MKFGRRSFMALASGILVPEEAPLVQKAYSFVGGWKPGGYIYLWVGVSGTFKLVEAIPLGNVLSYSRTMLDSPVRGLDQGKV